MVGSLLENETVDAEECMAILNNLPYPRRPDEPPVQPQKPAATGFEPETGRAEKPMRLPPSISPEPA